MQITRLEIIKLRKSEIIKPKEECGTCGNFPKAWTMAYVFKSERNDPIKAFLRSNKNFVKEELELI